MPFTAIWGTGFEMGAIPTKTAKLVLSYGGGVGEPPTVVGAHTGNWGMGWANWQNANVQFYHMSGRSDLSIGLWTWAPAVMDFRIVLQDGNYVSIINNGNTYNVTVNGTVVASGTMVVNRGSWHNIQIQVSISNTGYIKTKLDGNLDVDYSGDTMPGSNNLISCFQIVQMNQWMGWWGLDDIVFGYGDWPGDIRFDGLVPNGDSATHQWRQNGRSFKDAPVAPTVGLSAGPGLTGDYRYKLTLTDTDGETMASVASDLVQPVNQVIHLSNIPIGPNGTTGRKIYRTAAGGSVYKLVATIANNVDTTYDDSLVDGSLGANEPTNICYDKIDERGPNDSDFMSSAVNGEQELSDFVNWDSTKKLPLFLVHWIRGVKGTADSQQVKFLQKKGGTLYSSAAHNLMTSVHYEYEMRDVDPDGLTWEDATIDTLLAGVEQVV